MATIFDTATRQYTYTEFLQLSEELLAEHKTTGDNQSEEYLHYARLNLQRMKRLNKTFILEDRFAERMKKTTSQKWYVITEAWCGDGAQTLPVINQLAIAGDIPLQIILRDENPGIMEQYLSGNSKSIPVFVAFDKNDVQLFRWGPRPATAQQLMAAWRSNPDAKTFEQFEEELHLWYTRDKGAETLSELMRLIP